jgi:hypothetical protein
MLVLLASIVLSQSSTDRGALIGLRDANGAYRTVLVAQRGVAYVTKERKGELLRPIKLAVQPFRTDERGLVNSGRHVPIEGKFRISWAGNSEIGIELDASKPGQQPFTRVNRRVVVGEKFRTIGEELNSSEKGKFLEAGNDAKRRSDTASGLPESPDPLDWGFVRNEGKWQFVAAFNAPDVRLEFFMDDPPVTGGPYDNGEVTWRNVIAAHADAIDAISSRDAKFAVVVTKNYLYVHEASRTGLGREVRRITAKDERVVSFDWGANDTLRAWHEHMKD